MREILSHRKSESGFTLLELLLVIGVAAVLFLGISQITASWIDSEVATGAGQHMQRVSTIVQNYVQANWNNEDADTKLTPTADALNDPNQGWAALKTSLDQEGLLSSGELRSPLNVKLKIAYVTESLPGNNTIYRASIYSPEALMYRRVVTAARQAGNTGGMIASFPDDINAFGAFGQWTVPVTKLLPGGSIPCVPGDGTACLIAVISYNQQTLCGPFLYRNDVEGANGGPVLCKDGNTMTTNLQMASHDILNVGAMTADNLTVNTKADLGTTNIAGTTTMNGPVKVNGGMNVGGAMTVTGDSTFSNDVQMKTGTLSVINLNANTVQAPNINTNDLRTNDIIVNSGSLTVDNDVSVNGSVNMQGGGSQILAGTVNAGEINTSGGDVVVGTMNVKNSMNITGQINVTGTTLTADRMVANDCVEVTATGKKYGTCP